MFSIIGKARISALRGKNGTKLAERSLKNRALLKKQNIFAYNSRMDRDISKIPTDLGSAGQNHFFYEKSLKNSVALLKII
jgi:hypothetical protein